MLSKGVAVVVVVVAVGCGCASAGDGSVSAVAAAVDVDVDGGRLSSACSTVCSTCSALAGYLPSWGVVVVVTHN